MEGAKHLESPAALVEGRPQHIIVEEVLQQTRRGIVYVQGSEDFIL